jgi:hypothetical protein
MLRSCEDRLAGKLGAKVLGPAWLGAGSVEDAIYFDHCCDVRHHKGCPGGGAAWSRSGTNRTASGSGARCPAAQRRRSRTRSRWHRDLDSGIRPPGSRYTVGQAIAGWLSEGLDGRSKNTVTLNRHVLQVVVDIVGKVPPRELTTWDVRRVLTGLGRTHSSRTVVITHNALERAMRYAEANDYIRRNVAALVGPLTGQLGRPSKSLTIDQAACCWRHRGVAARPLRGAVPAGGGAD